MKAWARLIMVLFCLSIAVASADPLTIQGTATGSFSFTILGVTVPLGNSINSNNLKYNAGSFGPITGGNITLGSFDLKKDNFNYDPFTFQLGLAFTAPGGIGGSTLTANVNGRVTGSSSNVQMDFGNSPINFSFTNAEGSGSFSLTLSDINFSNFSGGQQSMSRSLNGTISSAVFNPAVSSAPEPASIALLGTFLGVAVFRFRKRLAG
jgi:hypothetical protein